jgi:cytochrome c biogenesis protein CcmG/thiol:disulfide interchange protein DsbE
MRWTPLLSIALIACDSTGAAPADSGVMAKTIPDLRYQQLSNGTLGAEISLVELAAERPVFINLWATWCVPCREEVVELGEMRAAYPGLAIVGIDQGDELAVSAEFIQEHGMEYTILFDPQSEAMGEFGAFALPANFLYDKGGEQRWFRYGMITAELPDMVTAIEAALEGE